MGVRAQEQFDGACARASGWGCMGIQACESVWSQWTGTASSCCSSSRSSSWMPLDQSSPPSCCAACLSLRHGRGGQDRKGRDCYLSGIASLRCAERPGKGWLLRTAGIWASMVLNALTCVCYRGSSFLLVSCVTLHALQV